MKTKASMSLTFGISIIAKFVPSDMAVNTAIRETLMAGREDTEGGLYRRGSIVCF